MEEKLIFHPVASLHTDPGAVGLPFENVYFATADGLKLHAWHVPRPGAEVTLLWFHGNAGNISHRLDNIRLLARTVPVHVFIFDYRGYGLSQGKASEEGTYLDGEAALRYLLDERKIEPRRLVLFGRSLGAAVAAEIGGRCRCRALILESPFTSVQDMAKATLPFLPTGPFLRTRYDVVDKLRKVAAPVMVIHGENDEIVPFSMGRRVFASANEPKEFYVIPRARHNDTYLVGGDPYFAALKSFIERSGRETLVSGPPSGVNVK
jgi:hypothetical protein